MTEHPTTSSPDDAEQAPPPAGDPAGTTAPNVPEVPEVAPVDDAAPSPQPTDGSTTEAVVADDEAARTDATADPEPAAEALPEEPSAEATDEAAQDGSAADAPAGDVDATPEALAEEPSGDATDGPAAEEAEPTGESTAPAAPAAPRPSPASVRPLPRPVPRPSAVAASPAGPAVPVPTPDEEAAAAHAATFGRVDEDGTVHVVEAAGERVVGQFPGASAPEALALYVRRFLDLQAKVALFDARLSATDLSVKEIDQTLTRLTEELAEPAAVGDLDALRARLEGLRSRAAERRAQADAERAAAREAAVAARTQIVEQAEKIATTDPSRIQWRPAGEQLRLLLDQWKDAQRSGPRIDRPTEESLWKRFSHARTTFDRERRHFFAELEARNSEAKTVKEQLVADAERLATSTDWGATSAAFRDLMTRWKAAGRANRQVDDALWARFRTAQDAFFAARDAANQAIDEEFRANLEVKEALLVEAEALLPVRDLGAAKAALRSLQDRWDAAGKVPRADVQRVEGRMRAVETAVREADSAQWRRSNPETRARAEGAAAQLEQAIAGLEADLESAKAAGDQRRVTEAQAALDARRAWLEQVQRAAQDARG
ncbi:DUF349 domain-containing protein [Cellulomonas dongxiuzhuiae]|uniref:DUF349 domain-containing protein n=1 Tax=Cellulomonas dongxiuzhuiae TaxID=2819979 RepID=A0ABX8GPN1_9CELL|nr:DUF349 domain-containing protein [Cellulomonas dongxiuzhuiae]MBO3093372.1 DUF349 domain-containing protein [Cellulomonas dongxiuzhuiae]QWC17647.1 DUF349 domain-containing protein [Cellulomonas dongxiuzhuiae]